MNNLMITLSSKIRKNNYTYTLVCRGQRSCIYAQHVTPKMTCFEVFIIRVNKAKTINGKFIPEKERFPADEDFGKYAWSYCDYESALKKFNKLEGNE